MAARTADRAATPRPHACFICSWPADLRRDLHADLAALDDEDTLDDLCRRHMTTPTALMRHVGECLQRPEWGFRHQQAAQARVAHMADRLTHVVATSVDALYEKGMSLIASDMAQQVDLGRKLLKDAATLAKNFLADAASAAERRALREQIEDIERTLNSNTVDITPSKAAPSAAKLFGPDVDPLS